MVAYFRRCVEGEPIKEETCDDRDSYEKICKIIETECFKKCRETVATTTVLQVRFNRLFLH